MRKFNDLEKANAYIDVCIDEEDYEKVYRIINKKAIQPRLCSILKEAFDHRYCTKTSDDKWLSLFCHNKKKPINFLNLDFDDKKKKIHLDTSWSHFFFAKLIRAKIQQKGTDCYYRRLDELVIYLERHFPVILINNIGPSTKLSVIFLLEMSATGVGSDQRSFAERARRVLQECLRDKKFKNFKMFYEFLARYNNGVGYFHESQYHNALSEFNKILFDWKKIYKGSFQKFTDHRFGRLLLLLPSIMYCADIQLKLQLAYHAVKTIDDNLNIFMNDKKVGINCIRSEAYQQMDNRNISWKFLNEVYTDLFAKDDLGPSNNVKMITVQPGEKKENVKGRLQNFLAYEYLENLKNETISENIDTFLIDLNVFFDNYKSSVEFQKPNRAGYFEQLADYLVWLAKHANSSSLRKLLEEIYGKNRQGILEQEREPGMISCPCTEKGIDLQRIAITHYENFYKNILKFFKAVKDDKKSYGALFVSTINKDEKKFIKRLKEQEKKSSDLKWRQIEFEDNQDKSSELYKAKDKWCEDNCLKQNDRGSFDSIISCEWYEKNKCTKKNEKPTFILTGRDYEKIMNKWDEHFLQHIQFNSKHEPACPALHFVGLQRWNSTSPARGQSLGGGYVLYYTGPYGNVELGLAIDPGFDFIRNLFHEGFSLSDIDIVLLSHAHIDHIRDFESMVTLLLELKKRVKVNNRRKLHAIMTMGVYRRLEHIIESPGLREFVDTYILDLEKDIEYDFLKDKKPEFIFTKRGQDDRYPARYIAETSKNSGISDDIKIVITPTRAYHNDYSEYSDSYGFVINISDSREKNKPDFFFGYTGDTKWHPDIMEQYKSCDALLVHLGSLIDREDKDKKKFDHYTNYRNCFDLVKEKNHPYLIGLLHFLNEMSQWGTQGKHPLILISEFGEEMRGKIRIDLIKRLNKEYALTENEVSGPKKILPVDVGLDIILTVPKPPNDNNNIWSEIYKMNEVDNYLIWCTQCEHYIPITEATFETYGYDEALFCVCETCGKSLPQNVLSNRFKNLYEIGRELQRAQLNEWNH